MLLRRITEHVKAQNWTAVALDFVIVVVGVFIGIQVANWNEGRANEGAYQDAMRRLGEESVDTLRIAQDVRATIDNMLEDVRPAIEALESCQTGAEAEKIVDRGLNTIRSSRGVEGISLAIDQLVDDASLLARQTEGERAVLRQFHTDLHGINETARFVIDLARAGEDTHPFIGFTGLVDPQETFNGVDVRRARINGKLSEVCKDQSFVKLFYQWERAHVYQLKLTRDLESVVTDNMQSLNLTHYVAEVRRDD